MSQWNFTSPSDPVHGVAAACVINLTVNDTNGQITGTVLFKESTYQVTGNSAAAGSVAGRGASAFALHGGCEDPPATHYVAVAGTVHGQFLIPDSINISLTRVRSADGSQYGWDGKLLPV